MKPLLFSNFNRQSLALCLCGNLYTHRGTELLYCDVFDSCFSTEVLPDGLYQLYLHEIITELHEEFPESSFLAYSFQEGEKRSQFAEILWLKNPKPEQHSGNEESANLCQLIAKKMPELLDFDKDLVHLEAASKIQLKSLPEEMHAVSKGLEKVEQELTAPENDGAISAGFQKEEVQIHCLSILGIRLGALLSKVRLDDGSENTNIFHCMSLANLVESQI
ncbi:Formin-like protein 14 [Camellia lanceoleosa]|uniref:Formin-like protein 14 n=1 Tax=Camellia lanceoleosa TaxID=1840588 RepID=A0ACC0GFD8_9ERIC|nr:Formin-like protein 14 [Camellia lanceoleosa]